MENNKCVLPYPKAFENDDYNVITHDNARVGAILKTSTNFEAMTAWIQASTLLSEEIFDLYYNEALKYKYGTEFGSAIMMDIIYEHIGQPYNIIEWAVLDVANIPIDSYKRPTWYLHVTEEKTNTYFSKWESTRAQYLEAFDIYYQKFEALP